MFKKFIYLSTALTGTLFCSAQTCDFEDFQFPQDQNYWNGSDQTGAFLYNTATFDNSYNADWMSWTGFSVSSETDVATPGWLNQYSVYVGQGGLGSDKFAIWYSAGDIVFDTPVYLGSMQVANTTYAAISMRDGDAYGKQFGSPLNAAGVEDGTEGKDWFLLTITATLNSNLVETFEFYLADYRSNDPMEHYILDVWETIDFSAITGQVDRLSFQVSSSDTSGGFMNTPAYFALDNLTFSDQPIASIDAQNFDFSIYPNPARDWVTIQAEQDVPFTLILIDSKGQKVLESAEATQHELNLSSLVNGVYFLQMTSQKGTRTERLVIAK